MTAANESQATVLLLRVGAILASDCGIAVRLTLRL